MSLLQIGKRKKSRPAMRDRVYLSVSSEGYGHSSRALALARHLGPDACLIGSYSYALERVKASGYAVTEVSQEVKFIGAKGSFDVSRTILNNPAIALGFNQVVQEEMDIIQNNGVSLVVADGRMTSVIAASRLDIPCLVITNQSAFYPFFERESDLVKLFGRSFEWVMKLWLCSAEEILIPDFLPPDTVCLPNLSPNLQVKKRTRFVGPLVAWRAEEVSPLPRANPERPLVVVSLGGHAYRKPLFDAMITVARALPKLDFEVLTQFGADQPLPDNMRLQPSVPNAAPHFKAASLVITQAGHSTAMELLTLGKPSIIVPDNHQIEQENNAQRMAILGVSRTLSYLDLQDAEQRRLREAIETVLDTPAYQERADELAEKARALNGAERTAQYLREYAHRLLAY